MSTVKQRLAERLKRLFARRAKKAVNGPPAVPAVVAKPLPAAPKNNVIHLTLTRRQVPVLVVLILLNVALIIAGTLLAVRMGREPGVVQQQLPPTFTPLSIQAINTEIAEQLPPQLPELNITVSPAPVGPTPTAPPNPLELGGTIFYAYRQFGRTNLWAQVLGRPQPQRLTAGLWDDADPVVSPDGTRLAFASRRDGNWNLYLLDLATGEVKQLTTGQNYKGHPSWSPDSQWLVFEVYRNNNLDIAVISVNGGDITPLSSDAAADYEPVWAPGGREILWVSTRSGNPNLWVLSLDHPQENQFQQLTNTPEVYEENPAYSRDGELVIYTDTASPLSLVYSHSAIDPAAKAMEVGQGQRPVWSPDGSSLLTVAPQENGEDYLLTAPLGQYGLGQIAYKATTGHFGGINWSSVILPETLPGSIGMAAQVVDAPLWTEVISGPVGLNPPYSLVPLPSVTAPDARLSDRVDEAYAGLRRAIAQAAGWDFLATLDNAALPLLAPPPPTMDSDSWLKTGRAFDFSRVTADAGWVDITREDYGFRTYWRVWVRTVRQDGSQGEPLHSLPWNFAARYSGRPKPYDAGGEYYSIMPSGYFVDFTTLAEDFGWSRVPAQKNWPSFFPGILYWRFEHRDSLDWLAALREVYSASQAATQTPVPSPTSSPTITPTPSDTGTPTDTNTPTPRPTWTPVPSRTRRPTRTLTPTITIRPSRTPTATLTIRPSRTPSPTDTIRPSRTPTATLTRTPTPSATFTPTFTPVPTETPMPTETPVPSLTPIPSATPFGWTADGRPFGGVPIAIPGIVEAENFNDGGEGVAYHDTTPQNEGNAHYRRTESGEEGVDISSLAPAPGYRLSQAKAGEWLKYTVNIGSGGAYNLTASVSCGDTACGVFHVEIDGLDVSGPIQPPSTAGWNVLTNVSVKVSLPAGIHVLKIVMDSNGPNGADGFVGGLDYLTFVATTP
jgi:TolB protein